METEGVLMRVPYERLKNSVRERTRMVQDEVGEVVGMLDLFMNDGDQDEGGNPTSDADDVEDADAVLAAMEDRLMRLKRKIEECAKVEQDQIDRCRARIQHLSELPGPTDPLEKRRAWEHKRLDRFLVDHLLRSGHHDLAQELAKEADVEKLVDVDIFLSGQEVVDALRNRDCSPALEWCKKNASRLKKMKSRLEFKLRVMEFIELVRKEDTMGAVIYAREHLSKWAQTEMKELQRAMATLAFKGDTECAPYKEFFDDKAWEDLIEYFVQENYSLHCLTDTSLLHVHLQAGLAALKVQHLPKDAQNKEDPLSDEDFQKLAEGLPYSKHTHSKLVCHITKELMDEDNPPMVLPNGYVYSLHAMEKMAKANKGKVTCVRTGNGPYEFSELQKAFLA